MDSLVNYCSEDEGVKKHADDRIVSETYSSSKRGKIKDDKKLDSSSKETKQKTKEKHHNYNSIENEKDKRKRKTNCKDARSDRLKSKSSGRSNGGDYHRNDGRIGNKNFNNHDRKNDFYDNKRKRDNSRHVKNDHQHSKNRDLKSRKCYDNDGSRYRQKKRSESPKAKASISSQKKRIKYSERDDVSTPTNSRHNGTTINRDFKEDTTKSFVLLSQRYVSSEKNLEDNKNVGPPNIPINIQSNQTIAVQSSEPTAATSLPSYYNRNIINPNKYADQIQKRKLIWGAKKTEDTTGKWDNAKFSQDTDGKVQSKFMRLMGIKATPKLDSEGNAETQIITNDNSTIISKTSDIKTREHMFSNMEHQYEVARQVTHTMRGVGLGFGSQPRQF